MFYSLKLGKINSSMKLVTYAAHVTTCWVSGKFQTLDTCTV